MIPKPLSKLEYYRDFVSVRRFGAKGDGVTDETSAIQAALDSGEALITLDGPPGTTYMVSGVTVPSDTAVEVRAGVTLKLRAGVGESVLSNSDQVNGNSNIIICGWGIIDGNKSGQTAGDQSRGIYLVNVSDSQVVGLTVQNCEDHGVHFSLSGAETGNLCREVTAKLNGLSSSSVGGSGIAVTQGSDFIWDSCASMDNFRTGLRPDGGGHRFYGCYCAGNGQGGIVPVSGSTSDVQIYHPVCVDNTGDPTADGIRLVGIDDVLIVGALCSGNDGSGIMVLNGCQRVRVYSSVTVNNGQNAAAVAATTGRDGVTVKNSGTANTDVHILGLRSHDYQSTKTQEYGIYLGDSSDQVILDAVDVTGNKTGGLYNATSGTSNKVSPSSTGVGYDYLDATSHTVTGTTAETDLASYTIPANALGVRGRVRITAGGEISGTSGTKLVRLKIGANTFTVSNQAASDTLDWSSEAEVQATSLSSQRIYVRLWEGNSLKEQSFTVASNDFSSAVVIKLTGQLGNSADSIIQRDMLLEVIR